MARGEADTSRTGPASAAERDSLFFYRSICLSIKTATVTGISHWMDLFTSNRLNDDGVMTTLLIQIPMLDRFNSVAYTFPGWSQP